MDKSKVESTDTQVTATPLVEKNKANGLGFWSRVRVNRFYFEMVCHKNAAAALFCSFFRSKEMVDPGIQDLCQRANRIVSRENKNKFGKNLVANPDRVVFLLAKESKLLAAASSVSGEGVILRKGDNASVKSPVESPTGHSDTSIAGASGEEHDTSVKSSVTPPAEPAKKEAPVDDSAQAKPPAEAPQKTVAASLLKPDADPVTPPAEPAKKEAPVDDSAQTKPPAEAPQKTVAAPPTKPGAEKDSRLEDAIAAPTMAVRSIARKLPRRPTSLSPARPDTVGIAAEKPAGKTIDHPEDPPAVVSDEDNPAKLENTRTRGDADDLSTGSKPDKNDEYDDLHISENDDASGTHATSDTEDKAVGDVSTDEPIQGVQTLDPGGDQATIDILRALGTHGECVASGFAARAISCKNIGIITHPVKGNPYEVDTGPMGYDHSLAIAFFNKNKGFFTIEAYCDTGWTRSDYYYKISLLDNLTLIERGNGTFSLQRTGPDTE
ncbi:MAG: hypothetical protein LBI34_02500 [Puniceicoccales bacterium]|nr:hypothetical protein [Puniceicoccales bacterium]